MMMPYCLRVETSDSVKMHIARLDLFIGGMSMSGGQLCGSCMFLGQNLQLRKERNQSK
jgi:hypothetical protein